LTEEINDYDKIIEKYILKSDEQSFVVMLEDKIATLENPENYHYINLQKPILKKDKYDELINEFAIILE